MKYNIITITLCQYVIVPSFRSKLSSMENLINYKPVSERTFDTQYQDLLKDILENGKSKVTIHSKLAENKSSGNQ